MDAPPEIFSVEELIALLAAAQETEADVLPMLVIGAFAGLRYAEIKRLDWSEVDLKRNFIEVKASKSKTARRRIIPIQPNLAAWLRHIAQGPVPWHPQTLARNWILCVRPQSGWMR